MNYRHIFHAGSFADVFKHIVLIALIQALQHKEKGCVLIDTHAGIGLYDLESELVQRNPEYLRGIAPLLQNSNMPYPVIKTYLDLVKNMQPNNKLKYYPGSPFIMSQLLRSQDILILNELHPEDYALLKKQFHDPRIHIHHRDAYEFLPAILPPTPRRGLVFIDPPYEQKDEFTKLPQLLTTAIKLFPQGVFAAWYPIVHNEHYKFLHDINGLGKIFRAELVLTKNYDTHQNGLRGSGIAIINAPYKIEETINPITHQLEKLYLYPANL
jgi:23S rRNA (adenine2030-N6)-methyltransferase